MRYILYLFTLALVFVGGMLVGNIYLPERSSSVAAAISVPDAQSAHPAIAAATLDAAQRNLHILNEALNSCPVVVGEEKERLIHQIDLFWARQDFDLKKARYELEIAKNTPGTAVTSRFAQASADYSAALKRVEKMAQDYFPQPQEEKVAEKPAKQAEIPAKQAETPAKQAEIPAKNIAPAKTAAPKQAEEKAPAKKAQQAEPAAVTQAQTPAEPQAAHADTPQAAPANMPQGAQTQETVAQETQTDELKTAAVNAPKSAEKPQTATAQETEQVKAETDKAPLANSTPETPAETAPKATAAAQEKIANSQERAAAPKATSAAAPQEQAPAPKATSAATPQEKAPQTAETAALQTPDLPAPKEQGSTAPKAQPTEPKN